MKALNRNRAELYLLFTREPVAKLTFRELEYYQSDDGMLMGFIAADNVDDTYHACLFDRNKQHYFQIVDWRQDEPTINDARVALESLFNGYKRDEDAFMRRTPPEDFFELKVKEAEMHPVFCLLKDKDMYSSAKEVIRELSYQFVDRDNNFVEQLQSRNGFDARIWELYLRCYFREENFSFNNKYQAPDFILEKGHTKVSIEATIISRDADADLRVGGFLSRPVLETEMELQNLIPLKFGSTLYSKMHRKSPKTNYWDMPHVKGQPFLVAIADFHEDMSMVWSMPGLLSILYGIGIDLNTGEQVPGLTFKKGEIEIPPLFLQKENENVSAVMFSAVGTLSKFNRMGRQAGFGRPLPMLVQKILYRSGEGEKQPDTIVEKVTEASRERWGDGIAIFHNPLAKVPLDPNLFPSASHHVYHEGVLESYALHGHKILISAQTVNFVDRPDSLT